MFTELVWCNDNVRAVYVPAYHGFKLLCCCTIKQKQNINTTKHVTMANLNVNMI